MVNSHTEKVLGSSPSLINRLKSIFFLESFCFCEKFRVDGFFWYKGIVYFFGGVGRA